MDVRVGIALGLAGYAAFLGLVISWAVRRARRRLDSRVDHMAGAITAGGGKRVSESRASRYGGKSVECAVDGKTVWLDAYTVGKNLVRVNYRLPAATPLPHIRIHKEHGFDRFGKAIGLNREVQTGDAEFDAAAYLDSRDRDEDILAVLGHADTRAAVRELLTLGYGVEFSRRGVEAYQLVRANAKLDAATSARAAARLAAMARHLPSFHESQLQPQRASGIRQGQLAGIAGGIGAVAIIGVAAAAGPGAATVDAPGTLTAVGLGLASYIGCMFLVATRLRGRSDALAILVVVAFLGAFAVPAGTSALVLWLNRALDHGEARVIEATVTNVPRKGDEVGVTSWRGRPNSESLPVAWPLRRTLRPGDRIRTLLHPGRFGWQWVEPAHERAP